MRKLGLGFAGLFLLQLGASAPQHSEDSNQSSPSPKESKIQKSLSAVATPQAVGNRIVEFFGHKTGKDLMLEKAGKLAGGGAAAAQVFSGESFVRSMNVARIKPGYVVPPPTPSASVFQIRREIQKIFDLNKKIKDAQNGRSLQLQHVQEQAHIHQKILEELEVSQKLLNGQKVSTKSALLAQEKLRIIHEETRRNAQMIQDLKGAPAAAASGAKAILKETPKAKIPAS